MRSAKISILVLIILAATVVANSLYIRHVTDELAKRVADVNTSDMEECAIEYKSLYSEFSKAERFISITVSHDDLTNIEESFADIIGAADAGLEGSVIMIKNRLEDALRHLGRLSSINLDSII